MVLPSDEYLPISMLNQYAYCPRRFWLMYVQGEMEVNAPVLEGTLQHERVHTAGETQEGATVQYRRVYLWSDRLELVGFTDLMEVRAGAFVPVEYKHGRMGRWLNDHIQLCAQALCLEERSGTTVLEGEIFYWESRRRERICLDDALRARTEATIAAIHHLLAEGVIPMPEQPYAKCRGCSLEPICLPREVRQLQHPLEHSSEIRNAQDEL